MRLLRFIPRVLACTAALSLMACRSMPGVEAGDPASDVAARVGDRAITVKEVDEHWRTRNPAEHGAATQQLYEGRRRAVQDIVAGMLIADAAKAKGVSAEAFEQAELGRRLKPVTDAEVVSFYNTNLAQMQGRSLESVGPTIRRYLQDQNQVAARDALVADLKKGAAPIRVLLDAPRVPVAVQPTDPSNGPASAPVTIVEFSDFECPFCQRVVPTLEQVRKAYGGKVRIVWKDFPLTQIHAQAFKASEAAHCAGDQGRFWEYHDALFANQKALQPPELKKHAAALGLTAASFDACLDSAKYAERVREGIAAGTALGVSSTPTIYVNGRLLQGAQPYEAIAAVVDEELALSAK